MAKSRSTVHNEWGMPGMGWRVALSIICFFALIAFLVLWLFFHADAYTVYQNIAVIVVSILVFIGVMGAVWAMWGMRYGPQMEKRHMEHWKYHNVPHPAPVAKKRPRRKS